MKIVKRDIQKAVSFEIASNIVSLSLAYIWFGNIGSCVSFTLVCVAIKLSIYCVHEELWSKK